MRSISVPINPRRMLDDLHALREFGKHGNGVVRQSLSPVDMASRHWLVARMQAAGLDAHIDGVGTVFGRSPHTGPALLLGSHTDTQPTGGWLDGALGVIYGLEVARALAEHPATAGYAVDVASWIDEEGTFYGCLGSRSFCGELDDSAFDAHSAGGQSLRAALEAANLSGKTRWHCEQGRYRGYLEAHIEQGPSLEDEDKRIGVVTAIVGSRNVQIQFKGQQNHAGTTPMDRRRDAGRAMVEYIHRIHTAFPKLASERTVWTVGTMQLQPNAVSIVPGLATMNLQFRDPQERLLHQLETHAIQLANTVSEERGVDVIIEHAKPAAAAAMDATLIEHLCQAAEAHAPGAWMRMPSAAVHDAQVLARHMPSAMLFVPSIGGISHAFEEDTAESDLVLGCEVLADAAARILTVNNPFAS